jgi:hypothetical protein
MNPPNHTSPPTPRNKKQAEHAPTHQQPNHLHLAEPLPLERGRVRGQVLLWLRDTRHVGGHDVDAPAAEGDRGAAAGEVGVSIGVNESIHGGWKEVCQIR